MPRKPKSEVLPSRWETVCYVICEDGVEWTARATPILCTIGDSRLSDRVAHGTELGTLLDFLNTLLPTSSGTLEQPR